MCVDGLGYVYVCKSYVVLDQCDSRPPCLYSLSAYGGVVGILGILVFCVSFV